MPSFSYAAAVAVASAAITVVPSLPSARAWAPSSTRSAYFSAPSSPPLFAASLDVEKSAAASAESNQRKLLEARLALERAGIASSAAAASVAEEAVNGSATTNDDDDDDDAAANLELLTKIDDDEGEDVNPSRIYGFLEESDASPSTLYDLVVIGGGPAGIAGAVRAAQLGRKCLLIDRPKAGVQPSGLDLFFGGPTGLFSKALRDASKTHDAVAMRAQGLDDDVIWKQITNTVVKLASRNAASQTRTLDRFKIGYLQGEAALLGLDDPIAAEINDEHFDPEEDKWNGGPDRVVRVSNAPIRLEGDDHPTEGRTVHVRAHRVLVATGSKSMRLPGIPFDGIRVHDSETINGLSFFPKSVVIAGAGIIAIEYANIFKSLGVEDVTLLIRGDLESASAKLGMDMDCVRELTRLLLKSGVVIREGTTVDEFLSVPDDFDEPVVLKMNDGSTVETDIFLAATGRIPRGPEPGTQLEKGGVSLNDRGMVEIKDKATLLTKSPNVAAAGDVIGPPALASTSVEQAQRAVESLFPSARDSINNNGKNEPLSFEQPISFGVWTIPEMGYYGMTKDQAEAKGHAVVEGVARFDQCLRGRVFAPDGLLKLVVDSSDGRVLGVHLIGKEAAEMVHYGMALVQSGTTVFDLLGTTFTAVTFHELFKEAALDANFKLDFGIEWQEIFAQLTKFCSVDDGGRIPEDELRKRFDAIDVDGSGELDEGEMRRLFEDLGRPISKRTIANLMRLSDADGNGTIDWEEFSAIFEKVQC